MDIELKKCSVEDLDILCEFSKIMFYDTFSGTSSEENINAYLEKSFNKDKILSELNNEFSEFYFLYYKDELVGYLKLNEAPAQSDINDNRALEIERIYISKSIQRMGLGTYLMSQAVSIAREKGKDYLWLGVWEYNEKALSFYKKHNFYEIGRHAFVIGEDVQYDFIMRKDL